MSGQTLETSFQAWYDQLNGGYDRLLGLIRTEGGDPETIAQALKETGELLNTVRQATIGGSVGLSGEQLQRLQQKVDLLVKTIHQEQVRLTAGMNKVKQGRRAVAGYNPTPYGMGYTEGKFIDSKK